VPGKIVDGVAIAWVFKDERERVVASCEIDDRNRNPAVAKELGPSMPISSLRAWRASALSPRVAIPFTRRIPKRASDPSLRRIMMALVRCVHVASLIILPIKIHTLRLRGRARIGFMVRDNLLSTRTFRNKEP
jgi:hypothetical protein